MKFYLGLLAVISCIVSLIVLYVKNRHNFLSNKLNLAVCICLFIDIVILSIITISFGLKLS